MNTDPDPDPASATSASTEAAPRNRCNCPQCQTDDCPAGIELAAAVAELCTVAHEHDKLRDKFFSHPAVLDLNQRLVSAELDAWRVLMLYGATPEIVHAFIRGQQDRICCCEGIESALERVLAALRLCRDALNQTVWGGEVSDDAVSAANICAVTAADAVLDGAKEEA